MPGIFQQMFHPSAKTTTNAGEKTPENVPKNHQNSYKCRGFSSKCSIPASKQLQTPEILSQMFHQKAKSDYSFTAL
ncbi:hypothetical protein [Gardnerella vaginalis]|uniref:hypothetical protein n=1 Tax=Gardnerella vaginalis TaxID=2702 RepID=UPI0039EEAC84